MAEESFSGSIHKLFNRDILAGITLTCGDLVLQELTFEGGMFGSVLNTTLCSPSCLLHITDVCCKTWMMQVIQHSVPPSSIASVDYIDVFIAKLLLSALGMVVEWSKVPIGVPWPLAVWSTLALGT